MSVEKNRRRRHRVLLLLLAGLALPVIAIVALLARSRLRPYDLPAPPARAPLASLAVHQVQWKDCKGVDAILEPGALLCDVVNCAVVEGFGSGWSPDVARAKHGAPSGEWTDPLYDAHAYYYEVPEGRVSLCLAPDSGHGHWVTVGYPKSFACKDVIRHAGLLAQLLELKGSDDEIYLDLRPASGARGGLGVHVKGETCDSLEFDGTEPGFQR
jgi:hypothetical protein